MADGLATPVSGVTVVVDDDDGEVRIDEATGTVERDQADGGVVVQFNAVRKDPAQGGFYENLADDLDGATLARISNELYEAIDADDRSRGQYLEIVRRAMDFLGLEMREPRVTSADTSAAVEGQSQVTNPLLLEATLKGWANAQGELLPADGPVKATLGMGEASDQENDLADALERDFNYYLTETATEYYPDTSHMLMWGTIFKGSGFKKVYRCLRRRRPVSESVDAKDLIVSDLMKDLRSCERITHQIPMRPSELKRMEMIGAYRKAGPLAEPQQVQQGPIEGKINEIQGTQAPYRPEDQPYIIWESQCELELDQFAPTEFKNKGIRLPYLVTMEKESRAILALRRDWREKDEQCDRKRMYVRYPYVPGPGFYGTGMIGILGNCSMAMTAAWREALDAGMYANFPSGTIAKIGGRQNTSDFRLSPGTFQPVETGGMPINQVIAPLPYKDVTPGLLALMDKITAQAKELGGVTESPTGEGLQNVPVGTMLANIEQATKLMAAAHKGMHKAQSEEIGLMAELFRENPDEFWAANRVCPKGFWDAEKFKQALDTCSIVPRTDPNTPSHLHRIAVALGLVQMASNPVFTPFFNLKELILRTMRVIRVDPAGLVQDAPPMPPDAGKPGPDPLIGQARMLQAQTAARTAQDKSVKGQQEIELGQNKLQTQRDIASAELAREMVIHKNDDIKEQLANQRLARDQARAAQQASTDQVLKAAKIAGDQRNAAAKQAHERNMDIAGLAQEQRQFAHDRQADIAEHALNVHTALHPPPKPKG